MIRVASEILDRTPPSNLEAETWVLGSILLKPSVVANIAEILRPADFYAEANRKLYTHLLAMWDERRPIDVGLITERLHHAGDLEAIGGTGRLAEILNAVPVYEHAMHYARLVVRAAKLRALVHAATDTLRDAYAAQEEPETILDRAEAALMEISTGEAISGPVPIATAAMETLDRLEAAWAKDATGGLMVGFPPFDQEVGGLFPGELTILAARPSVGKSSLARQWAYHVASRGKMVYLATFEMTRHEVVTLLTCSRCGVSSQAIRTRRLSDAERGAFAREVNTVASTSMVIRDKPGLTAADIRREVRRLIPKGLALVVVDYLQLLAPADRRAQRYEQVGRMTADLKELAQEFEVPVLCLCQLNREVARDGGWPKLHHLRESGSIEQDANNVIFIHLDPGAKRKRLERERLGELIKDGEIDDRNGYLVAAKVRSGAPGGYRVVWDPEATMFSPPDARGFAEFEQFGGSDGF